MAAENCIDVQDFRFKSAAKAKVFSGAWSDFHSPLSLLATASRFGLVFAGAPDGFKVYQIKSLLEAGESASSVAHRSVPVDGSVRMLQLNCDDSLLAVLVAAQGGQPRALLYPVTSFLTAPAINPCGHVVLASGNGQTVTDFAWNPVNPASFCLCLSDGQVSSFEVKGPGAIGLINTVAAGASCVAWSPKGKQLVAATKDGRLCQYMPDLRPARVAGPPEGLGPSLEAVAVAWLSSFQFGVVFRLGGADDQRLSLCIVNTPKAGPVTAQDFDDVCYSSGDLRQNQFYLQMVANWGVLLVASANGAEVGLLGQKEGSVWQQWTLEDSARAELPLEAGADTFPLGMSLCTSATVQLPWEESQLPHMPVLLLLSHCGLLCVFHSLNLKPNVPAICQPIEAQPLPGLFINAQPAPPSILAPQAQLAQPGLLARPQVAPATASPQPQAALLTTPVAPNTFSTPPPSIQAPATTLFGGSLTITPNPVAPAAAASPFSVPPPTITPIAKPEQPAPKPVAAEVKAVKEPVVEPVLSEESFIAASNAILRHFSEELATSLKQSSDTPFTIATCEESAKIATNLNTAEEQIQKLKITSKECGQQLNNLQALSLEAIRLSEEARTRQAQRSNPGYKQVARTRPLDPYTQSQKQDIASRLMYIENQSSQAISAVDQALTHRPFRPSSNMALHRTLLVQRRCMSVLSSRLDSMAAQVGQQLPAVLDMSSLTEALPKTPLKPQAACISRDVEHRLSSFLKDRPIVTVKRKSPPPDLSPVVKVMSPLKPISPPKMTPLLPKPATAVSPQAIAVDLAKISQPTRFSAASFSASPKNFMPAMAPPGDSMKQAAKVAALAAPNASAPFSFNSKTFSFSADKPVDFTFAGAKEAKTNIFAPVEVAKPKEEERRTLLKPDVEVIKLERRDSPEKHKIIEVKVMEKESSPLLASILQSKTSTSPATETPKSTAFGFAAPSFASPTSTASSNLFASPISASAKNTMFSGSTLFATPTSSSASSTAATTLSTSTPTTATPKFSFGPVSTPALGSASSFAFGSLSKGSTPLFGAATPSLTPSAVPDSTVTTSADAVITSALTLSSLSTTKAFSTTPTEATGSDPTPLATVASSTNAAPTSTPSLFGSASPAPVVITSATSYGTTTLTAPTTKPASDGPFGSTALFGNAPTPATAAASPFASASVFGSTPATTTTTPAFGSTPLSTTTATPAFGSTPTFGAPAPAVSSASATPFASTPVFGAAPASSAPVPSPFAAAATGASSFSFAQAAPAAADQVTSLFGGMGSGGSLFGSAGSFAGTPKPAASIFGGSAAPLEQSPFGGMQACSPANTKNLFGQPQAQANPFSSPKAQSPAPVSANLFGQSPASAPIHASNTSAFGQSGGSLFGQSFSPSKSVFGSAPSFGSPAGFGAPPAFGSMGAQQPSNFGSPNRIFGSSNAGAPSFGQQASSPPSGLFGAAADGPSFGNLAQQGPPSFGQPQQQQQQQQQQQPQNNNQPGFGGGSFSSWR